MHSEDILLSQWGSWEDALGKCTSPFENQVPVLLKYFLIGSMLPKFYIKKSETKVYLNTS